MRGGERGHDKTGRPHAAEGLIGESGGRRDLVGGRMRMGDFGGLRVVRLRSAVGRVGIDVDHVRMVVAILGIGLNIVRMLPDVRVS